MPIAFYCRARPQECDALPIFRKARRMFLGYPLIPEGVPYDPNRLRFCLVDPSTASEPDWQKVVERDTSGNEREFSRNRNFVRRIEQCRNDGAIVLVPRPKEGVVYLGRITGPFEIVDDPEWAECYLQLRAAHGLPAAGYDAEYRYVADVSQGWPIADGYQLVSLFRIPGWIRRTLAGRSTYGEFKHRHPLDDTVTAYRRLDAILNETEPLRVEWALDVDEIKWRLVDAMTPNLFEHVVVSLLQLDHPEEAWLHSGGAGDGGIDGFGSDASGRTVAVMQAKYVGAELHDFGDLSTHGPSIRRYWAEFLPGRRATLPEGVRLLHLDWVVSAVVRHWRSLPLALTLRIGERPPSL